MILNLQNVVYLFFIKQEINLALVKQSTLLPRPALNSTLRMPEPLVVRISYLKVQSVNS